MSVWCVVARVWNSGLRYRVPPSPNGAKEDSPGQAPSLRGATPWVNRPQDTSPERAAQPCPSGKAHAELRSLRRERPVTNTPASATMQETVTAQLAFQVPYFRVNLSPPSIAWLRLRAPSSQTPATKAAEFRLPRWTGSSSIHRRSPPTARSCRRRSCRPRRFPDRHSHEESARTMSPRLMTNRNAPMSKAGQIR